MGKDTAIRSSYQEAIERLKVVEKSRKTDVSRAGCGKRSCLYCLLTPGQKDKYQGDYEAKREVLLSAGYDKTKAAIGAKGEAIFAASFDLFVDFNVYPHGDPGYDFSMFDMDYTDGKWIDVKTTVKSKPNALKGRTDADWRPYMLYVFFRVCPGEDEHHAFFQGFFDEADEVLCKSWAELQRRMAEWKSAERELFGEPAVGDEVVGIFEDEDPTADDQARPKPRGAGTDG